MLTPRPERIKKIIAGLVVTGVAGVGVVASQPAYADSPFITWTLSVTPGHGNKANSFSLRWTDSTGKTGDVCNPTDVNVYMVTGLPDEVDYIQAFPTDDCSGAPISDLTFKSPLNGSGNVNVTFDGSGVHLG
jgi:hypothetical protein